MQAASRSLRWLEPLNQGLRWCFVLVLAAAFFSYVWLTRHWDMLVDSPVMHYVVFLTKHGMKPYSDITDNNLPGTYMVERAAMAIFGAGDVGWRVYDITLELVLTGALVVIAWPYDWMAGVLAGGLFALRHGSEGAWFVGEREQEITVMLALACAFAVLAVRRRVPVLTLGFGLLAALAASIKPTMTPFGLCGLGLVVIAMRRQGTILRPYLLWGLAGYLTVLASDLVFLVHYGAVHAFLFVLRDVTPVYVGLNTPGKRFLILHVLPLELIPLLLLGAAALHLRRRWNWEQSLLLLAAANGFFSYFIQQKGFYHHRYLHTSFALFLAALQILPFARTAALRAISVAALLYSMGFVVPGYLKALRRLPGPSALTHSMEAELGRLGTDRLQGRVQCFDLTFGCLNSLYHLDLVENTGFTGDLLLFPKEPNPATDHYRRMFLEAQAREPAAVLVVTNQEFGASNSFDRLARWPALLAYMNARYHLAVERSFPAEDKLKGEAPNPPATVPAYRIYVRDGF